jgi:hypothetical protein
MRAVAAAGMRAYRARRGPRISHVRARHKIGYGHIRTSRTEDRPRVNTDNHGLRISNQRTRTAELAALGRERSGMAAANSRAVAPRTARLGRREWRRSQAQSNSPRCLRSSPLASSRRRPSAGARPASPCNVRDRPWRRVVSARVATRVGSVRSDQPPDHSCVTRI